MTYPDDTVFVDAPMVWFARDPQAARVGARHGHRWCHMWSKDLEALHRMASRIGMKRIWFQDKPGFPHYDLIPTKRQAAIRAGAVERPLMDYLRERNQERQGNMPSAAWLKEWSKRI